MLTQAVCRNLPPYNFRKLKAKTVPLKGMPWDLSRAFILKKLVNPNYLTAAILTAFPYMDWVDVMHFRLGCRNNLCRPHIGTRHNHCYCNASIIICRRRLSSKGG
jgi:hypothetical protein